MSIRVRRSQMGSSARKTLQTKQRAAQMLELLSACQSCIVRQNRTARSRHSKALCTPGSYSGVTLAMVTRAPGQRSGSLRNYKRACVSWHLLGRIRYTVVRDRGPLPHRLIAHGVVLPSLTNSCSRTATYTHRPNIVQRNRRVEVAESSQVGRDVPRLGGEVDEQQRVLGRRQRF
eukprot:SAG31_NODE_1500_length_8090_cov_10.522588_6_plen_175_part_00